MERRANWELVKCLRKLVGPTILDECWSWLNNETKNNRGLDVKVKWIENKQSYMFQQRGNMICFAKSVLYCKIHAHVIFAQRIGCYFKQMEASDVVRGPWIGGGLVGLEGEGAPDGDVN